MDNSHFVDHLRSEKLRTQDARGGYSEKKLVYATTLLGVGSLGVNLGQIGSLGPVNLGLLLYLVPWVAIAFDLYILGEDYSVKRIGKFLADNTADPLEKTWEAWIAKRRDPFAPLAMPVLTTLILVAAAIMLWVGGSADTSVYWIWIVVTASVTWGLSRFYRRVRRRALAE